MIRFAQAKDVPTIHRLICELENTPFEFESFQRNFEKLLEDDTVFMYVYEEETIKGFMDMTITLQLHHNAWIAEIKELIVDPAYRGQKIGKQLLDKGIETAQEKNCVRIELASNQKRKEAHRFYLREGMNCTHYAFTLDL